MTQPPSGTIQVHKPMISEEAIAAAVAVLRSGWIGLGPKTAEFEAAFAAYVGSRFAVAVNSATAGLHLALVAAGIGPGDEVLTTPLTFVSTNHAILYQRATPVFVDVDDQTLNLDLDLAERAVTPRTRAIMVVHYGGNPVDLHRLYEFAQRHRLQVVEDAAHACGAAFDGRRIGARGTAVFSFHAVKNLPLGDGGMVTTDDEERHRRLVRLRWLGIDRSTFARTGPAYAWEYDVDEVGFKYHMNDIAAAMGVAQLPQVGAWNARRGAICAAYRSLLADVPAVRFVADTPRAISSHHLCAVRVAQRDAVIDALRADGIGVGVHYKPNYHYAPYRADPALFPIAERAFAELISLPVHLHLTDDEVAYVAQRLRAAVGG